jgi:hypothetical protein
MESMRWAVNLLAVSPDVQARARRELEQVCGDQPVRLIDRSHIHFNEAVSSVISVLYRLYFTDFTDYFTLPIIFVLRYLLLFYRVF